METYNMLSEFAQTWGLLYFVGIFIAILIYALAPSRKKSFEEASRIPLRED
ncbi:cbb3-type cytochrome c oxidase subunit 3 [Pseudochelatococcus sp. G4_1912]|uniref:cbb3-type cytochrome c oxidase subunit 3 n=1 Tax=Pseudochelatococcus sp. G4_1912 TaxID=3114288 RepID=UPI0039C7019B